MSPTEDAVHAQLSRGYFGVRRQGDGLLAVYDPELADVEGWRRSLGAAVGEADADLVQFSAPERSARRVAQVLSVVERRDWHPAARTTSMTFGVDSYEQVVRVNLDAQSPPELLRQLVAIDPDYIRATAQGSFRRRRR
ncbi:hypothetical protein CLV35_0999 [Motilibacter peucedani]|uniref:Uncharacterized protein n=1 Tax=Motilibacter peucedani TaxID=598650 RepID=A0A420XUL5_9ACTN|nr:hypothetical protein [Motilibacter peucedani]RKS80562.1 hypothetical protein CLV35_0999 [Motilibacter peucedani]